MWLLVPTSAINRDLSSSRWPTIRLRSFRDYEIAALLQLLLNISSYAESFLANTLDCALCYTAACCVL
jgi:hypothetical protein